MQEAEREREREREREEEGAGETTISNTKVCARVCPGLVDVEGVGLRAVSLASHCMSTVEIIICRSIVMMCGFIHLKYAVLRDSTATHVS